MVRVKHRCGLYTGRGLYTGNYGNHDGTAVIGLYCGKMFACYHIHNIYNRYNVLKYAESTCFDLKLKHILFLFRKERQAKKEEEEKKKIEAEQNQPKIKELTEEEADRLEKELEEKVI